MADLETLKRGINHLIGKLVRDYAAVTQAAIKAEAPVRLRKHVTLKVTGSGRSTKATVRAGGPSPIFLKGAPAHPIGPRNRQALFWPGISHPVEGAHHPLIPANDFVARGARNAKTALDAALTKASADVADAAIEQSGISGVRIVTI